MFGGSIEVFGFLFPALAAGLGQRQCQQLLNYAFGKTTTLPTYAGILWVSAHTADPGEDGQTAGEVSGSNYARVSTVAADWNAATLASPSLIDNIGAITFPQASGSWGTITHMGLWGHATTATEAVFVAGHVLVASKAIGANDTLSFAAGDLDFTLT